MATIKELLGDRVQALRDLADRIQQELEGDADLEKLSRLADEIAAAGDSFASTITKAQETLTGDDGGGEQQQDRREEQQEEAGGGGGGEQQNGGEGGGGERQGESQKGGTDER